MLQLQNIKRTDFTCSFDSSISRYILELNHSEGIHDLGAIKWDMALCLLAVYLICYFSLWKGISTSGKVRMDCPPLVTDCQTELFFRCFRTGCMVHGIISIRSFIYSVDTRHYVTGIGRRHQVLSLSEFRRYLQS